MDLQLKGKRAVITGGSRGIGKAITWQLAREGVNSAICARTEGPLKAAAKEIARETGRRILPFVADLSSADSTKAFVGKAVDALGGVEILINNGARVAGTVPEDLANITDEMIRHDFEEKFLGYLRCAREVVPYMRAARWGRIINISGLAARTTGSISAGARNVAVVHLTKTLAVELGPSGINVNAIYPATAATEALMERMEARARLHGINVDEALKQACAGTAIGRLVSGQEIAYVVVFLASPLSVGITGEVLAVTGGAGRSVYY